MALYSNVALGVGTIVPKHALDIPVKVKVLKSKQILSCGILLDDPETTDINEEDRVACWDSAAINNAYRTGKPVKVTLISNITDAKDIFVGPVQACVRLHSGVTKCWAWQQGLGVVGGVMDIPLKARSVELGGLQFFVMLLIVSALLVSIKKSCIVNYCSKR